jgi:crossover junction endodeoxyribonuclease RusA
MKRHYSVGRAFKYVLPFPPSVNSYWRRHGNIIHISPKGKAFREEVISLLNKVPYTRARLRVEVAYLRPDKRIRDLDNYQKALYDALKHARVYQDDCQIVDKHEYWIGFDPLGVGSTTVTIEEIT